MSDTPQVLTAPADIVRQHLKAERARLASACLEDNVVEDYDLCSEGILERLGELRNSTAENVLDAVSTECRTWENSASFRSYARHLADDLNAAVEAGSKRTQRG